MAKTFKNLTPPVAAAPVKPVSERDFFDLTDEPISEVTPKKRVSNNKNTSNTSNTLESTEKDSVGNTSNTGSTPASMPVAKPAEAEDRDLRQTFVVSSKQLEQLRDHVHARRAQGDYEYSQKQALQEALSLLFNSVAEAPPRPSRTREMEQRRRDSIRKGRTKQ